MLTWSSNKLRLECQDGSLLAMVFGDLPEQLRSSLVEKLELVLGPAAEYNILRDVDTSETRGEFTAFHFSVYARMGTQVRCVF